MSTETSSNKDVREIEVLTSFIYSDLFGVADCQFAGHVLQLAQSGVQAVFPIRRLDLAGLWLCQRVQQPQNRQNFLCDLE